MILNLIWAFLSFTIGSMAMVYLSNIYPKHQPLTKCIDEKIPYHKWIQKGFGDFLYLIHQNSPCSKLEITWQSRLLSEMLSTNSKRTGCVPESNATLEVGSVQVRFRKMTGYLPLYPYIVHIYWGGVKQPGALHPNITTILPTNYNGCLIGILVNSLRCPYITG